jgi:diaminopimelate epimerase
MRLTKHHGLGNDFLITFASEVPGDLAALARRLCDRHRGVGADGLIVLTPATRPGVDHVMTLHNADGSRAEISGNGIRCVAQAIALDRGVDTGTFVVETLAGDRTLVLRPGDAPHEVLVEVDMGAVGAGPALVREPVAPTVTPRRAATFDIGNPHLVVLVDDPAEVDLAVAGPAIEADYADGINVHFVAPQGDTLVLRVWERGAGITAACGSGAVVSAHAVHRWGLTGEHVRVEMPGGAAEVVLGERCTLIGPSVFIAEIVSPDA